MAYRDLIIDDLEYSDEEIQMIQTNLLNNDKDITVYQNIINENNCLCAFADIKYSYNEVLCSIGDAYIGDAYDYPI